MDLIRTRIREYRRCPEYAKPVNSGIELRRGPVKSDGVDRIYPEHRTRVLATARITERNGLVTTGGSKSLANRRTHS